jgi:hypothetical protein
MIFQLAEVAVSRQMFGGYPDAHRPAAGATRAGVTVRWGQIRQTATGEVRLDERKANGLRRGKARNRTIWLQTVMGCDRFRCAPP